MTYEDKYLWMENLNDPRVKTFIEEENKRFRRFIGDLPEKIVEKIKPLFFVPQVMMAEMTSSGYYILVREKDELRIEKRSWSGEREIIISSRELGEDAILTGFKVSRDDKFLAYYYSIAGADVGKVRIIDLRDKSIVDELEGSIGNIIFLGDNKYYYSRFYRTEKTPDGVPPPTSRIFIRENKEEAMVFGEGVLPSHFIWFFEDIARENVIVVVSHGWNENKIYGGPIGEPTKWRLVFDAKGYPAMPINYVDAYYVILYDGKGMGRVVKIKNNDIEEVVSEQEYPLRQGAIVGDKLILEYLIDAVSEIRTVDLASRDVSVLLGREHYTYTILDYNESKLLLKRETFWEPYSLYLLENSKITLLDKYSLGDDYIVEEDFAISKDGTKIHYFLVRSKNAKQNRNAIVYGYGGFRISLTPRYIGVYLKFVDDGNIFVQANLRGGSEYGEKWHRAGMHKNKINVFDDFAAVIRKMRDKGYRIVASGRSNGGLLVGATITRNPEIVDVAIIGYPVLDMLRFHKLYIGMAWVPEYGNPDNPDDKEYLMRYSPYHNIREGKSYPVTLVYTGLHDDRVHPAHALKFVARMKEVGAPVYLRVETKSGHIGSTPMIRLKEQADILAFIYKALRIYP